MDNDSNHPRSDHADNGQGHPPPNNEGRAFTETFVFSGNSGPSFLAAVHNLVHRLVGTLESPTEQPRQEDHHDGVSQSVPADNANPSIPSDGDIQMTSDDDDPPLPELPVTQPTPAEHSNRLFEAFSNENDESPPSRPMRPLPRSSPRPPPPTQPHAHFHAHTPNGVIDLFTFNVGPGGAPPPPPPDGTGATFTFNLGPIPAADVLNGFEAFLMGMPIHEKEREPDPERARILLKGMEVVPEGLVRRLEHAGGVPGGHGTEESGSSAGCAVCWGPLLDDVEPGEWESALHRKEKEEKEISTKEDETKEEDREDEFRGRIVALPCAHVYHAECLLPWFSRQTTCPTCRFDVDPDSLTWTPRPPRSAPPPAHAPAPAPAPAPQQPNDAPISPEGNEPSEQRRANAAEALRFTAFMNTIFAGAHIPPPPPFRDQNTHNQPQNPSAPIPHNQPQNPPAPSPQQDEIQFQDQHPVFGPPPQPSSPPMQQPPPPIFFRIPSRQAQPGPSHNVNQTPDHHHVPGADLPPPITDTPQHPPGPYTPLLPRVLPMPILVFPTNQTPTAPAHLNQPSQQQHMQSPFSSPPTQPYHERREWVPPEPVGKTLRQRVEIKERELGLRCDDVVCGVAPTDEEPIPASTSDKRVWLHAAYDAHGKACEHTFHPACLVTSARVAGAGVAEDEVPVACPTCRAEGTLDRLEWEEGVRASEAEIV